MNKYPDCLHRDVKQLNIQDGETGRHQTQYIQNTWVADVDKQKSLHFTDDSGVNGAAAGLVRVKSILLIITYNHWAPIADRV